MHWFATIFIFGAAVLQDLMVTAITISASWETSFKEPVHLGFTPVLVCSITDYRSGANVYLKSPLNPSGYSGENCAIYESDWGIDCESRDEANSKRFVYRMRSVDTRFSGDWSCVHRNVESNKLDLLVTDQPSIQSISSSNSFGLLGGSLLLACDMAGKNLDAINLTWSRESGEDVRWNSYRSGSTSILRMTELRVADNGPYYCSLKRQDGSVDSQRIDIEIYYPPARVELSFSPEAPLQVGQRVNLECESSSSQPSPIYYYYKRIQAKIIKIGPNHLVTKDDNVASFQCSAYTSVINDETFSQPRTFVTHFPPSDVLIKDPTKIISEGHTQIYTCESTSSSNPKSSITWIRQNNQDPSPVYLGHGETKFVEDPSTGGFMIESSIAIVGHREFNQQDLICKLSHFNQSHIQQTKLNIRFNPRSVQVIGEPNHPVIEGALQRVYCRVSSSNPEASVRWIRELPDGGSQDVKPISENIQREGDYGGIEVESVISLNVTREFNDLAVYCEISHSEMGGKLLRDYKINVYYPPEATVVINPNNQREGRPVRILCGASGGNPSDKYSYQWEFLDRRGNRQPLPSLGSRQYNISNVGFQHMGTYLCRVTNQGGSTMASGHLDILFAPVMMAGNPVRYHAELGTSVSMKLQVHSNPDVLGSIWFKVTTERGSITSRQMIREGSAFTQDRINGTFLLRVKYVTRDDYGQYACELEHLIESRIFLFDLLAPANPLLPFSSIRVEVTGSTVQIEFQPPEGNFTQMIVLVCLVSQRNLCNRQSVDEPHRGVVRFSLRDLQMRDMSEDESSNSLSSMRQLKEEIPPDVSKYVFQIQFYDGDILIYKTQFFSREITESNILKISLAVAFGVLLIGLLVALIVYIKHRREFNNKENIPLARTVNIATPQNKRRGEYFMVDDCETGETIWRPESPSPSACFSETVLYKPRQLEDDHGISKIIMSPTLPRSTLHML